MAKQLTAEPSGNSNTKMLLNKLLQILVSYHRKLKARFLQQHARTVKKSTRDHRIQQMLLLDFHLRWNVTLAALKAQYHGMNSVQDGARSAVLCALDKQWKA